MRFSPLILLIGAVAAADRPEFWGWQEKGCKGMHFWIKRAVNEASYCSDSDYLKNSKIQSIMLFLPDPWTADLYAENGCPFPDSDDDSKRKRVQKEICIDIDPEKYPSFRLQQVKEPWLYGWHNEDCTGEPAEISPDTASLNETLNAATGYCADDHKPFKAIAFDLPETITSTLFTKDDCKAEPQLQTESSEKDLKEVPNRVCTKNDAEKYPSYRLQNKVRR